MILQALCSYYDRLSAEPENNIPVMGYAVSNVSSCITLDEDGNVAGVISLLDEKRRPVKLVTPIQPKRAGSRPEPAFLCEKRDFLFGVYNNPEDADYRFKASREIHESVLSNLNDAGAKAVIRFLNKRTPGRYDYPGIDTSALEDSGNIIFRLKGEDCFIHDRANIKNAWANYQAKKSADAVVGQCLVTGETGPIAKLHGNIGGFGADKPTVVSFNQGAFVSYRKPQGLNAPVSELAVFKYVTALDNLIGDRKHRVNLFEDKVVFWAEKDVPLEESAINFFFGGQSDDDKTSLSETENQKIKSILSSHHTGKKLEELGMDADVRFYILGISSNKTRLVIRFFYTDSFGSLLERLLLHYRDIGIVRPDWEQNNPSPYQILLETALRRERKNVSPSLESGLMRCILWGTPYPYSLFISIMNRIRAEAADGAAKAVTGTRVGMLKGYLNRISRLNHSEGMMMMALNEQETNIGYLLGRVFALLERAQSDALGKVNASIVDKYLNSALAAPQTVFPMLLSLAEKHIAKSENYYTKIQIGKIMDKISSQGFPKTMASEEQGKFMIGYYHQRQANYAKHNLENNAEVDIMEEK